MGKFIKRFFKRDISQDDTVPVQVPVSAPATLRTSPAPAARSRPGSPTLVVGHAQDVGKVRSHNEDVLFAFQGTLEGLESLPVFGLFVVADGMGGHSLGEHASAVAARTIAREVIARLYVGLLDRVSPSADLPPLHEVMYAALEAANRAVAAAAPGGGTTATAALILGEHLTLAHVGDSRAYLVQGDKVDKLTRDHSFVERLQDLGQLSAQEAAVHPQRNLLYRAIGQGQGLEVDVTSHHLPRQARLLLCSDGLWGMMSETRLLGELHSGDAPQAVCERLVAAALEGGGQDNITAVMVERAG